MPRASAHGRAVHVLRLPLKGLCWLALTLSPPSPIYLEASHHSCAACHMQYVCKALFSRASIAQYFLSQRGSNSRLVLVMLLMEDSQQSSAVIKMQRLIRNTSSRELEACSYITECETLNTRNAMDRGAMVCLKAFPDTSTEGKSACIEALPHAGRELMLEQA